MRHETERNDWVEEALLAFVIAVAVGALAWALWSLPDWLDWLRTSRATRFAVLFTLGLGLCFGTLVAATLVHRGLAWILQTLRARGHDPRLNSH